MYDLLLNSLPLKNSGYPGRALPSCLPAPPPTSSPPPLFLRGIHQFCRQLIPNSAANKIYIVNLSLRFLCTCHILFFTPKKVHCFFFCALIVFCCALFAHSAATMQPLICCINLGQEGTGKGRRVGRSQQSRKYSKEPFRALP